MSTFAKLKNRAVSILCLFFFLIGIGLLTMVSVTLVKNYQEHQHLVDIRDELIEEQEYYQDVPLDEDYYTVYVKDNYSIYDTEGTIFVFTK